jgi:uncharacterized membrane protein YidH (DUF202 family)
MEDESLKSEDSFDQIVVNEIQLILAEKRTSLAMMRTGIAVFALPLSVLSLLVATSKYYDIEYVMHFLIPLFILNFLLVVLGFYLVFRSIIRMRRHDNLIQEIKKKHSTIAEYID